MVITKWCWWCLWQKPNCPIRPIRRPFYEWCEAAAAQCGVNGNANVCLCLSVSKYFFPGVINLGNGSKVSDSWSCCQEIFNEKLPLRGQMKMREVRDQFVWRQTEERVYTQSQSQVSVFTQTSSFKKSACRKMQRALGLTGNSGDGRTFV